MVGKKESFLKLVPRIISNPFVLADEGWVYCTLSTGNNRGNTRSRHTKTVNEPFSSEKKEEKTVCAEGGLSDEISLWTL